MAFSGNDLVWFDAIPSWEECGQYSLILHLQIVHNGDNDEESFLMGCDKCRLWLYALSVNLFAENVFVEDKFILAEFFVWRKIVLRKIVWQKNVLHNIVLRKIFWEHLLQKIFLQKICLQKSFCGTFNQAWVGYILPTQA